METWLRHERRTSLTFSCAQSVSAGKMLLSCLVLMGMIMTSCAFEVHGDGDGVSWTPPTQEKNGEEDAGFTVSFSRSWDGHNVTDSGFHFQIDHGLENDKEDKSAHVNSLLSEDATSGIFGDSTFPLPFRPLCGSGAAITYQGDFKPPKTHSVRAWVSLPAEACAGIGDLPVILMHHGFMMPTRSYRKYAELIAGYGGFAVVRYDAGNFVPDSDLAYEWLNPLVNWVKDREDDGSLVEYIPGKMSVNVSRIGVVGHSRGGNIAALQLNSTRLETEKVVAGFLIDPVGCGTRMAACGYSADGTLDTGWYRAGWDAVTGTDRQVMIVNAGIINGWNNVVCTCRTDQMNKHGKCPIWIGPRCKRDHTQKELYFDAAPVSTERITIEAAKHWSFLFQPTVNITAASAVSWLTETVRQNNVFKAELGDYLRELQADGILAMDKKQQ